MAGVLSICGARLPSALLPPNFANPRGYFEPAQITELNAEILENLDTGWDDPFAGHPKEYLSNFDTFYHQKAREVLRKNYEDADFIVLKDPRINVLLPFWRAVVRSEGFVPFHIIMVRHPMEVARSLHERDGFPIEKGLLLWLDNMLSAERDSRGEARVFVAYEDLLSDWDSALSRVERLLGGPLPRRTSVSRNEVLDYLTLKLRHHHFDDDIGDKAGLRARVKKAYECFVAASKDVQDVGLAVSVFAELRSWLDDMQGAIGPVLAHAQKQYVDATSEAEGSRSRCDVLDAEVTGARAELANVRATLASAEEALSGRDHFDSQVQLVSAELAKVSSKLTEAEAGAAVREFEMHAALERLHMAEVEVEAEGAKVASLSAELIVLSTKQGKVEAVNAQLTEDLQNANVVLERQQALINDLKESGEASVQLGAGLKARLVLLNALREKASDAAHAESERSRDLTRQLADESAARGRAEYNVQAAEGEQRLLRAKLGVSERKVLLYSEDIAGLRSQCEQLAFERAELLSSTSWRLTFIPRLLIGSLYRKRRGPRAN
jgi:hypothetical protein